MKMVKVALFYLFVVVFLSGFVSINSQTLIRGGRGVGETGGNLNP